MNHIIITNSYSHIFFAIMFCIMVKKKITTGDFCLIFYELLSTYIKSMFRIVKWTHYNDLYSELGYGLIWWDIIQYHIQYFHPCVFMLCKQRKEDPHIMAADRKLTCEHNIFHVYSMSCKVIFLYSSEQKKKLKHSWHKKYTILFIPNVYRDKKNNNNTQFFSISHNNNNF